MKGYIFNDRRQENLLLGRSGILCKVYLNVPFFVMCTVRRVTGKSADYLSNYYNRVIFFNKTMAFSKSSIIFAYRIFLS